MSNLFSLSMNVPSVEKCTDHVYNVNRSDQRSTVQTKHYMRVAKKRNRSRESACSVYEEFDTSVRNESVNYSSDTNCDLSTTRNIKAILFRVFL